MKNSILFIAILSCSLIGQATTLNVECSNNSIIVTIDTIIVTNTNAHDFIGIQIDSIFIKNTPQLEVRKNHKVNINNKPVCVVDFQNLLWKKISPFIIKDDNILSVYRESDLIGEIVFKNPMNNSYIKDNISFRPCYTGKNQFVLKSEMDTVIYELMNHSGFTVDLISLIDNDGNKIGAINYNLNKKDDIVKIPVTLKNAESLTKAHVVISVEGEDVEINGESEIIIKKQEYFNNSVFIWIIVGVILSAIIGGFFYRKKKRKIVDLKKDPVALGDIIKNREARIEELNKKICDLETQLYYAQSKESEADGTISQLRAEIINLENIVNSQQSSKNENEKLTKESKKNEELNKKVRELETKLYDAQSKESEATGTISQLRAEIITFQNTVNSLQSLKSENEKLSKENIWLLKSRDNVNEMREKLRTCVVEIQKMKDTAKNKDKQIQTLSVNLESAERSKASKDKQIKDLSADRDRLSLYLKEEKQTSEDLRQQMGGFSKQNHFLYLIDEALDNVERMLPVAFGNVIDETLRRKLVDPIVFGTPGLDENGMDSYKIMWREEIYDNQVKFFGKNVLQLTDGEVMEQLRENFIENLALRDSFNKLARLYLFSNVGWLNVKLVETGFDVDAIQTLFIELKNLFNRFGVEIAYPHLFIDAFDENKHRDSHRCDIFSIFAPNREIEARIHTKEGECLIVDLVRIGLPKSKTATRRIPMVSLPNF